MCLGAHLLQASGFYHGETLPTNVIGQPDPAVRVASRARVLARGEKNALCWLLLPKMCASARSAHGCGSRVSSDLKATLLATLSGLRHEGHTGLRTQLKQERGAAVSQFSSPDPMLFAPERKSLSVCGPLQPARLVAAVAR